MIDHLFLQIGVLLGVTVAVAFIMRMLRQPLMTAYLIAGIVAGPFFLDLLQGDQELFHTLSEFGVLLLLFVVGLSLNFDHIKRIGKTSTIVGLAQISFTSFVTFFISIALGFSVVSALYLGIAMTFSSTILITKLLADKKDTEAVYGRHVFGLMIVQDLVVLLLMVLLASITEGASMGQIVSTLVLKVIVLIAMVILLSRFVIPKLLEKVATSGEFLFIFTITWCFGIAGLLHWLGFSVEVGALIAGLTLGSSSYQPEISSRIKPLRDFFIVIFFIILGSELSVANLSEIALPGVLLSLFVLFGSPFILYHSFRLFKFTRRNSFLASVSAAQVSEFGFVLLIIGRKMGHLQGIEMEVFTLVALITIVLSSYVITYNNQLYYFLLPLFNFFGKDKYQKREYDPKEVDVWVLGYHRMGWKICEMLLEKKVNFGVIDFDPRVMEKLREKGMHAYFGDVADIEFLAEMPFEESQMIISTLPAMDDQITLIKHIRKKAKGDGPLLIANVYQLDELAPLYKAGADFVMMPHMVGGNWVANVLKDNPWTKDTLNSLKKDQTEELSLRFAPTDHD